MAHINMFSALVLCVGVSIGTAQAESVSDVPDVDINQQAPNEASAAALGPGIVGTSMRSTDLENSIKFYTEGLGMTVRGKVDNERYTEMFFAFEGREDQASIILIQRKDTTESAPDKLGSDNIRVVLRMPDVAAVAERLSAAGYPAGGDVISNGPYKILMVQDPDGNNFELVQFPQSDQQP